MFATTTTSNHQRLERAATKMTAKARPEEEAEAEATVRAKAGGNRYLVFVGGK